MDNIYWHPKKPNETSLRCYLSYLRDKRKLGEATDEEFALEEAIADYLKSNNEQD